ncbi:MAG: hypothetical protein WAZ27_03980 [Minisyncoccia bacterium]
MNSPLPSIIAVIILLIGGAGWYWYINTDTPMPSETAHAPMNATTSSETTTTTNDAGAQEDLTLIATDALIGTWQDSTDTGLVREFKTNNVFIDSRDGKVITRGEWKVFTDENAPAVSFEVKPGRVYMTMTTRDAPGDTMHIKVNNLSPEQLQLVYMDRPGMSFYSRAQ